MTNFRHITYQSPTCVEATALPLACTNAARLPAATTTTSTATATFRLALRFVATPWTDDAVRYAH